MLQWQQTQEFPTLLGKNKVQVTTSSRILRNAIDAVSK